MTYVRREIVIAVVEDIEHDSIGIEVTVPDGMTTLEAIGLIEIGKQQHLQSKHNQGPTVHQAPTATALADPAPDYANGTAAGGYKLAIGTLADVALRTGSPAARWAAEYLNADPDKRAQFVTDSCTCRGTAVSTNQPDPDCPVHHGRRARGPKPPPVGPGCVCDGSGRACPRHGEVI